MNINHGLGLKANDPYKLHSELKHQSIVPTNISQSADDTKAINDREGRKKLFWQNEKTYLKGLPLGIAPM